MSVQSDDGETFVTIGIDALTADRYDDVTLENGEVLIYDEDDRDAWFQSDSAISLDMMA